MEIASIKGDTALLLYHPAETAADVGQQYRIVELPERNEGLVVQIISNDSLEYAGLQQELIQHILEQHATQTNTPLDREVGMGEIKSLKLATAKIRKRINQNIWQPWDGWIPTRNVEITRIEASDLLNNVLPNPLLPLPSFARFNSSPIQIDGPRLNMVNVIAGVKGSGKSHLAKHLVNGLSSSNVPCIVYDINGEYLQMPNAIVLRWGQDFLPNLADVGYDMLKTMVNTLYPLNPSSASEAVFESRLPNIFNSRKQRCEQQGVAFTIDIAFLRQQNWGGGDYVESAIDHRLEMIDGLNLFHSNSAPPNCCTSLQSVYDSMCSGSPLVFDMRELSSNLQQSLVRSMNRSIENICENETGTNGKRYPFVFFEEAHFYISDSAIINIITRGRHIGMASVFVTNTPHRLPDTVFRQLDNLFLLALTHKDDIRNVSKNSFTDEDTIESFATRMPVHHALIMGNVTDRYPLVVHVDDLADDIPRSGETKSTWDRLINDESANTNEQT